MARPKGTLDTELYAMSWQEIAEELGMSEGTVRSIARKALAKLHAAMILEGISPESLKN